MTQKTEMTVGKIVGVEAYNTQSILSSLPLPYKRCILRILIDSPATDPLLLINKEIRIQIIHEHKDPEEPPRSGR